MECVIACLSSAVSSFSEHLCGLICSKVGNPFTFKSNYSHLQQELQRLNDLKSTVGRDHDESVPGVNDWSRNVEETGYKVRPMQAKIEANKERCCGGFKNLFLQSREVAEALKEVRGLEVRGNRLANLLAASRQARAVELMPVESIDHQPAASKNLATILNHLNNDKVRTIGVWGQGGIGKTTLVKNLNNMLKDASSTTPPFSIVIWITVSSEWDLKSIQTQIARRLNMEVNTEDSTDSLAAKICERLKREEKFLLLLDDVWKGIDLDALGIPRHEDHATGKIILTTRVFNVFQGMKTHTEIHIHVLNDDEAWKLFCKSAGKEANLEDVEPVAWAITKECGGLPLAINVMGTSMRKKTDKRLWMNALKELQKSAPHNIPGMEARVYKSLKWSYDSLQGNNIRSCFLFCSLYPEGFSIVISELVQCWLAEGLLDVDEQQSYEDIYNSGVALVENLKDCCLLENGDDDRSGTVKMHDVVRDVAIWIASSSEDECKSLVQSGTGSSKFPVSRLTPSLKRISFMRNALTWLPESQIPCSEASTLLLQNNNKLEIVPEAFLVGFEALRVLNLSDTNIQRLPLSLIHLGELRALLLSHCRSLNELPPVGRLRKLQVLDCSHSGILKLPEGMEQLSNLRELNLSGTKKLKTYRAGLVSRLSGLEILDMSESNCRWCLKTETNEGNAALLEELGCLERLIVLMVDVNGTTHPFSEYAPWMERLKSFRIWVSGVHSRFALMRTYAQQLLRMIETNILTNSFKNKDGKFEERQLLLSGLDLSGKWTEWLLLTRAAVLELESCRGLNNLFDSVGGFVYLKSLSISFSNVRFKPTGGCRSPNDLLPNLEELILVFLHSLESISELVGSLGLKFSRLKVMTVVHCPKLKYLLSCDDFTQPLEKLELICLADCSDLSDMLIYSSGQTSMSYPVAPNLREIHLKSLPKLKTLSRQEETWQHLEYIYVEECKSLKKLPLNEQSANTLKEIRGDMEWWKQLEWDDNDTSSTLQPLFKGFKPIDHQPAASKNLARIMNLLNDDEVRTIGVWGKGGIGKTTLVKNLNNMLKDASSTTPPFSIVIWITVSREWDHKSIQAQIARRLNMEVNTEDSTDSLAAKIWKRLKREEKFLLLLDGVWENIDLVDLGIPRPEDHAACKIILTTRSLDVCRVMKTDKEIAIHVLNDDEAWKLFCKNAGEAAILEDVEPVARAITKECGGLPLAINVVGTSMRNKTSKDLWEDALTELQKYNIPGMEAMVYPSFKWSYDSLQGNNIRSCFLFCSLYPEGFSIVISELVQCWLAEGLLDVDEQQSYEDIYYSGVALVENLKDCCLLENGDDDRSGTVKMHDVVRHFAIWIASSSEDECKSLVQSGTGSSKFPVSRLTPSLKRISFMRNALTWLPDSQIPCSEASTLLLQNNNKLEIVPEAFLVGFEALRVLNLSDTNIQRLPLSLIHLGELRALLLSHCRSLNELPPVGRIRKLQVLDCSHSGILKLPEGMEQLSNLRELNLSGTKKLKTYRAGLVSRLSGLEILDMSESNCRWRLKTETNEGNAALVEELGCLERLIVLMVDLNGTTHPLSEYAPWMERLKSFRIRVSGVHSRSLANTDVAWMLLGKDNYLVKNGFKNKDGKFDERELLLSGLDLSGKLNGCLFTRAAVLELECCMGLNNLFDSVGGFVYLKSLSISSSNVRFKPTGGCRSPNDLLPNLEELHLIALPSLESISELVGSLGLKFSRLKVMTVVFCPKLKYLLSCDDFTQPLQKLELIYLQGCDDLSAMFIYSSGQTSMPSPVAPNLQKIVLLTLPNLKTLSRQEETWQHLEHIFVTECRSLKKLPLNEQSANTLKEIRGEQEWWKQLEWDDDVTSSTLQPLFKGPEWWH